MQYLFFWVCPIFLTWLSQGQPFPASNMIIFFVILHYGHMSHIIYPLTSRWAPMLIPWLSYYEYYWNNMGKQVSIYADLDSLRNLQSNRHNVVLWLPPAPPTWAAVEEERETARSQSRVLSQNTPSPLSNTLVGPHPLPMTWPREQHVLSGYVIRRKFPPQSETALCGHRIYLW
jgi:hypothetical protein